MAYQAQRFEPLSLEQLNPLAYALQQGIQGIGRGADLSKNILDIKKQKAELPYVGQQAAADAAYKQAMAQYLSNPYQMQRFMTPLGKALNEQNMIGTIPSSGMGNGVPGQQRSADQGLENPDNPYPAFIQKTSVNPTLLNKANAAQLIYNQVNDIDTQPLEKFSGLGGHAKRLLEQGKGAFSSMGFDVKPSQEWRDYEAYMSINKNAIMDAIRSALATSVVPKYVMQTLSPMVDPSSPVWSDPEQVKRNVETLKSWLKPYAGEQTANITQGVPTTLEKSEKRHKGFQSQADVSKMSYEELMNIVNGG